MGVGRGKRAINLWHQQVRDHGGVPRAGPQDDPVGLGDSLGDRGGHLGGLGRDTHVLDGTRGDGDLGLAGHDVAAAAVVHIRLDVDRRRRHGQDASLCAEETPDPVEAFDRIVEELPQAGDQQVAEGVPVERAGRVQAQLHDVAPGQTPLGFLAEGRQRHAQVAGRQDRHLLAQSAGATAVVGDSHNSRQRAGDMAQRPQGCGQAVSAAEGDDVLAGFSTLNPAGCIKIGHQSLPMSRCITRTVYPCERRRSAIASEDATERCFPPVHPTAIVTNGFNSAR